MMSADSRIGFGLQIVFVCLYITPSHYHYCANFIWRHWTYKMLVRYNLSSVWVRLSIFSQLSIIQYVGLCVFSLTISFVMIEIIYILSLIIIIKWEVWTITHRLGLGRETMVCTVCLSIFLRIRSVIWDTPRVFFTESKRDFFTEGYRQSYIIRHMYYTRVWYPLHFNILQLSPFLTYLFISNDIHSGLAWQHLWNTRL